MPMDTRPFGTCFFEQYAQIALPMRRILESKVSKVGNGFYGHFGKMGLFVFSRENQGEQEARKAFYMEAIRRQNESEQP